MHLATYPEIPQADILTEEDWEQLEAIYYGLKPFWETTLRLEGNGANGSHGVIWEALPALDMLLTGVERQINTLQQENQRGTRRNLPHTNPLLICYQNAWETLSKYNALTDKSYEIYAAAALLNPCLRKRYFDWSWTDQAAAQIEPMIEKNRGIWKTQYYQESPEPVSETPQSSLSAFIACMSAGETSTQDDDFNRYINGRPTPVTDWKAENLFRWWMQCDYPGLRTWAFDTLSVPAMSTELERIFSQSKRSITVDRNRLTATAFEELQCMKHWLDQGLYEISE